MVYMGCETTSSGTVWRLKDPLYSPFHATEVRGQKCSRKSILIHRPLPFFLGGEVTGKMYEKSL